MSYKFLEHVADVKFLAKGDNLENMFISAADALNEVIRGDIVILENIEKEFALMSSDKESLLYAFLEEFLVLLEGDDFLVSSVRDVKIESSEVNGGLRWSLKCVIMGDDANNYKFTNDVKAVTYSEMFVRENKNGWECQVVLDV